MYLKLQQVDCCLTHSSALTALVPLLLSCCCCCCCSVAFKLVSSTNLAASVKAAEMGSGEYNFIPDGVNTPARLNPSSLVAGPTATSLKTCLKACSDVNLCSGVVFGQFSGEDTISASSCKLIMGKSLPGSSLRTLIKANFMGLNTNMKVSAGYYSQPGTTTVTECPASVAPATGSFCLGGDAPGAAPKQTCAAPNAAGTQTLAGSESADDCGAWLLPGWFYNSATSTVEACPENNYCPGGEKYSGLATPVGKNPCPAGTKSPASSVSMADCDALVAGYYYKAPGAISADTVQLCNAGFWCNTEDVAIVVDTTTPAVPAGGRNPCPVGSSSPVGVKLENECTILLAGYEFAGGDINAANVKTCGTDRFCAGDRPIAPGTAPANEVLGTPCVEGTGVAKKTNDDDKGATSANDCLKLYEGYYYTGVGTDISRSTVLPCLANQYCEGYPNNERNIVRGAPTLPKSCPAGTKVLATTPFATDADFFAANNLGTNANSAAKDGGRYINDCDTLRAGYYFTGAASISATSVVLCTADYYCNTEGVAIALNTATPANAAGGYNACPAGVKSLVGSDALTDCNILRPTYYYSGAGATIDVGVVTCPVDNYW
jgi:hypothetical protein